MAYEVGIFNAIRAFLFYYVAQTRPQWMQAMMPEDAADATQAEALYREVKTSLSATFF